MLDAMLVRLAALPSRQRDSIGQQVLAATDGRPWIPNPGPQTQAALSTADVLLYGGQGGGGKSDLLLGLALTVHHRALIMRRLHKELRALSDRAIAIRGRDGFVQQPVPALRTPDGRLVEFGSAQYAGDEQSWQGQPHDLLALDEAAQFLESQVRFLMGWVRSTDPAQRCRTVLASNPPLSAEGDWMIGMFRPWLDLTHPDPARPGELRWFVTDPDGKDMEVGGPGPVTLDGKTLTPKSRTFIPAKLSDNPYLVRTGYQRELDALPEPIRSAVRDGNFMAARADDAMQVIPSDWVVAAQRRWQPGPPRGASMTAVAVDVARGGRDETVLATRYGGWFAPLLGKAGIDTRDGPAVAALVFAVQRDAAPVVIDMGGGWGGSPLDHLKQNGIAVVGHLGAEGSYRRTADGRLGFVNRRAESWWRLREALDPHQREGSPIALPDDPMLLADLTAPRWHMAARGIQIESKDEIRVRLGRSPDRGDAVVMCWHDGQLAAERLQVQRAFGPGRVPAVTLGYGAVKRRAAR
ncbi:MAG: terminase [Alphaproteobacteria bacterium]|nr:terminase [Alphaproteobacteria bacterium]